MAKKLIGLNIEKMDSNIYKLSRLLLNTCEKAKRLGLICSFISTQNRKPYFEVFLPEHDKEIKDEPKTEN
jgi:hypothetical protein